MSGRGAWRTALASMALLCAFAATAFWSSGNPNGLLPSILDSGSGCRAPCWHGTRPGVTTRVEFDAVVSAEPDRFVDLTIHDPKGWARYSWTEARVDGSVRIFLDFRGAVVEKIRFIPEAWPDLTGDCHFCTQDRIMFSYAWTHARVHNLGNWFDVTLFLGLPDTYYAEVWLTHPEEASTLALDYGSGVVAEGPLRYSEMDPTPSTVAFESMDPVVSVLFYDTDRVLIPGSMREEYPWTGFDQMERLIYAVDY